MEHCAGVHRLGLTWFQSYLSSRTQHVSFNNALSECSTVLWCAPGVSLGLLLFCIYMLPLDRIIGEYGIKFHFYADDTWLYIPLQPNGPSQIQNLEACVSRVKIWMSHKFLMLNAARLTCWWLSLISISTYPRVYVLILMVVWSLKARTLEKPRCYFWSNPDISASHKGNHQDGFLSLA